MEKNRRDLSIDGRVRLREVSVLEMVACGKRSHLGAAAKGIAVVMLNLAGEVLMLQSCMLELHVDLPATQLIIISRAETDSVSDKMSTRADYTCGLKDNLLTLPFPC